MSGEATVQEFFEQLNRDYGLNLSKATIENAALNVRAQLIIYGHELLFADRSLLAALEVPDVLIQAVDKYAQGLSPGHAIGAAVGPSVSTREGVEDGEDNEGLEDVPAFAGEEFKQPTRRHKQTGSMTTTDHGDEEASPPIEVLGQEGVWNEIPSRAKAKSKIANVPSVPGRTSCPLCPAKLVSPEAPASPQGSATEPGWQLHLAGLGWPLGRPKGDDHPIAGSSRSGSSEEKKSSSRIGAGPGDDDDDDDDAAEMDQVSQALRLSRQSSRSARAGSGDVVGEIDYACITGDHGVYALKDCLHIVCGHCLVEFIRERLNTGKVLDFPCPVRDCKVPLDPSQLRDFLPKEDHDRYEEAMLRALISADGTLTECPKCRAGISIAPVEISPNEPITEKRKDGKPFSREAFVHFKRYRVRCACGQVFCGSCRMKDYHPGYTCESWADYQAAPQCRFCGDKLIAGENKVKNPISPALSKVCTKDDCADRAAQSCTRFLPCGCPCRGIRGELACPPCLDCELGVGDDYCSICYAEPKRSAPCIKSGVNLYLSLYSRFNERRTESEDPNENTYTALNAYNAARQKHGTPFVDPTLRDKAPLASDVTRVKREHASAHSLICYEVSGSEGRLPPLIPGLTKPIEVCKHVHHYHCVVQRLASKWPQARITFGFKCCPDCRLPIYHPSLIPLLQPIFALEQHITSKAIARLEYEEKLNDPELTSPDSPFYKDYAGYAMKCFVFYQCYICKLPYFGGGNRCQDASAGFDPAELVCPSCQSSMKPGAAAAKAECNVHGTEWLGHKCRFCCNLSTWSCWGNTHFCDVCHKSGVWQELVEHRTGNNKKQIWEYPQCESLQAEIRLLSTRPEWNFWSNEVRMEKLSQLRSDPNKCPLRVAHPPTGFEFSLGCIMCSANETADASEKSKTKGKDGQASPAASSAEVVKKKSLIPDGFRSEFGLPPCQTILPHLLAQMSTTLQLYALGRHPVQPHRQVDMYDAVMREVAIHRFPYLSGLQISEWKTSDKSARKNFSLKLKWSADFDQNGLFYLLGTQFYTRPWVNPAQLGFVTCTSSRLAPSSLPPEACLSRETIRCVADSDSKAFYEIHLHGGIAISVDAYTMRHYISFDGECLRNWRLLGSNNGEKWNVISAHVDDQALDGIGSTHTWMTRNHTFGPSPAYSRFRIEITGPNSNGNFFLPLSGLEFYGRVTFPAPCTLTEYLQEGRQVAIAARKTKLADLIESKDLSDYIKAEEQMASYLLPDMFEGTVPTSVVIEADYHDSNVRALRARETKPTSTKQLSSSVRAEPLFSDLPPVVRTNSLFRFPPGILSSLGSRYTKRYLAVRDVQEWINPVSLDAVDVLWFVDRTESVAAPELIYQAPEHWIPKYPSEDSAARSRFVRSLDMIEEGSSGVLLEMSMHGHQVQPTALLLCAKLLGEQDEEKSACWKGLLSRIEVVGEVLTGQNGHDGSTDKKWVKLGQRFTLLDTGVSVLSDQVEHLHPSAPLMEGDVTPSLLFCPFTTRLVQALAKRHDQSTGSDESALKQFAIPKISKLRVILTGSRSVSANVSLELVGIEIYGRLWWKMHTSEIGTEKKAAPHLLGRINGNPTRPSALMEVPSAQEHAASKALSPLHRLFRIWVECNSAEASSSQLGAGQLARCLSRVQQLVFRPYPSDLPRWTHLNGALLVRPLPARLDDLLGELDITDKDRKQYQWTELLKRVGFYKQKSAQLSALQGIKQLNDACEAVLKQSAEGQVDSHARRLVEMLRDASTPGGRETGFVDIEQDFMEETMERLISTNGGIECPRSENKSEEKGEAKRASAACAAAPCPEPHSQDDSQENIPSAASEGGDGIELPSLGDLGSKFATLLHRQRRTRINPGVIAYIASNGFSEPQQGLQNSLYVKELLPCITQDDTRETSAELIGTSTLIRGRCHFTYEGLELAEKQFKRSLHSGSDLMTDESTDLSCSDLDAPQLPREHVDLARWLLSRAHPASRLEPGITPHDILDGSDERLRDRGQKRSLTERRMRPSHPLSIGFGSSPLKPARYIAQPLYEQDIQTALKKAEIEVAIAKPFQTDVHPLHNKSLFQQEKDEYMKLIADYHSQYERLPRATPGLASCSPVIAKACLEQRGGVDDVVADRADTSSDPSSDHSVSRSSDVTNDKMHTMYSAVTTLVLPPSAPASDLAYFYPKRFVALPFPHSLKTISGAAITGGISGWIRGAPYVVIDLGRWTRLKLTHFALRSGGIGMVELSQMKVEDDLAMAYKKGKPENAEGKGGDDSSDSDESSEEEERGDEPMERRHEGRNGDYGAERKDYNGVLSPSPSESESDASEDECLLLEKEGSVSRPGESQSQPMQKKASRPKASSEEIVRIISDIATEGISYARALSTINSAALTAARHGANPDEACAAGSAASGDGWKIEPSFRICESADDDGGRAYIRNWQVIGSVDGVKWDLISLHVNETALDAPGATALFPCTLPAKVELTRTIHDSATIASLRRQQKKTDSERNEASWWPSYDSALWTTATRQNPSVVQGEHSFPERLFGYRFIALVMSGPNSMASYALTLSAIELYGDLITCRPADSDCPPGLPFGKLVPVVSLPPTPLSADMPCYVPEDAASSKVCARSTVSNASPRSLMESRQLDLASIAHDALRSGVQYEVIHFPELRVNPFVASEIQHDGRMRAAASNKQKRHAINLSLNEQQLLQENNKEILLHGGCFHYLGTKQHSAWTNPNLLGLVGVACTPPLHSVDLSEGHMTTFVSLPERKTTFPHPEQLYLSRPWQILGLHAASEGKPSLGLLTEPSQRAQFAIDLGPSARMYVTHYALLTCMDPRLATESPRSWRLDASLDAKQWIPLRVHEYDATLTEANQLAVWRVLELAEEPDQAHHKSIERSLKNCYAKSFRYFRIIQTGPNANDHWSLALAGIELFGTLFQTATTH